MKFAVVCLLAIPAVFAGLLDDVVPDLAGGVSELAGNVAKDVVTDVVTEGVSKIAGDKIGGQVGAVAGELAGTLTECYVDGVLTGGSGCAGKVVDAALDKAGKEIIDNLKQDAAGEITKIADKVSGVIQGAISDVSKDIGDTIGGDLGAAVGGAVSGTLTNLAGTGIKDAVNAVIKPPTSCVDKDSICPSQKSLCTNAIYSQLMAVQCCKTCSGGAASSSASSSSSSAASSVPGTAAASCKDTGAYCTTQYKSYCTNAAYASMMVNCPKMCGKC